MGNKVLKATRRTLTGKQVKAQRRKGLLPAVMYGHMVEPTALWLDAHSTSLTLAGLSSSSIVTIDLEGEQHAALVREKQKDFIKNTLIHLDFQVVSLTEKIRAMVRVEAHGISPAVKDFNAVIMHNLNEIEVEALPQDLPERFIIDMSKLTSVGASIHVRDLEVSDKVEILTPGDEIVIVAAGAAAEAEEAGEGDQAEPEVIERGKKEAEA
jgi:large subunit ribosomal protein L25